jgi:hypothetical protein
LADSVPRDMQHQQQHQQQQAAPWRNPQDPRYPPLLQGQTPPDTPDGAHMAAAAAVGPHDGCTVVQPEQLAIPQQQRPADDSVTEGHVWEVPHTPGQNLRWKRGELLGESVGAGHMRK